MEQDTKIKELEKDLKFYKEWYEVYKQEISERNIKARQVLAKIKGIKETDIMNLHEINILDEIEKELDLKLKESIPVSLVEEKIEKYQNNMKLYENEIHNIFNENNIRQEGITVLQELLEKREKKCANFVMLRFMCK